MSAIEFQGSVLKGSVHTDYEIPREGDTLLVFCRGCGKSFAWVCPGDASLPPSYHSKGCKKRIQGRMLSQPPRPCKTPQKRKYKTAEDAEEAFREHTARKGYGAQPYRCWCGNYHLGNVNFVIITPVLD